MPRVRPTLLPAAATADAYTRARERMTGLILDAADPDHTVVPACPEWTIHDLVAHLAGGAEDVLAGRMDGVTTRPWTAAQVDRHRTTSTAELLEIWEQASEQVNTVVVHAPDSLAARRIFDLATHEHDLRGALRIPRHDLAASDDIAWRFVQTMWDARIAEKGLPPLRVISIGNDALLGGDDPVVTLRGERHEVFRTLSGRRSDRQWRAMDWSADPTPYLAIFSDSPLGLSDTDLFD